MHFLHCAASVPPTHLSHTLIGSSSHFEIAIATTMGLFWEVPVMLGLVYLGKALGKRGFWAGAPFVSQSGTQELASIPVRVEE